MPTTKRRRVLWVTVMAAAGAMLIASAGAAIAKEVAPDQTRADAATLLQQAATATAGSTGRSSTRRA